MKFSKGKKRAAHRLGQLVIIIAVLVCVGFAMINTHQLNQSIDLGNRKIVLNYGNQVAARLHDLFERVDISLGNISQSIENLDGVTVENLRVQMAYYEETWELDASGVLYEDGSIHLSDGSDVVFENEISLRDVLSYSEKLNISRQTIEEQDMLVFAKPCQKQVENQEITGAFAAIKVERLEKLLGDYGYSSDSFLVLTQSDGDNIWRQGESADTAAANCFTDLEKLKLSEGDSLLQMKNRMTVSMDGTLAYTNNGQSYYMAYVPLDVNYWYILVSVRSDSIDLTELARQHFIISSILIAVILVMAISSIIYLIQRNRSISEYNKQLQVATNMVNQANKANEANRAKQEFLAKVSHDIRTPLNGVMGMVRLAKEDYENQEKCLEYLEKATISAKYLLGLLNDVLDMSQIESGKQRLVIDTVDMRALLREIQAILETSAGEKGISFQLDDSQLTHSYFAGDALRIKQILMNLCSNAVKYTHTGGQILVGVREVSESDQSFLTFQVQDNGEGIGEDKLDTIFKPFEQVSANRQDGVGLGLSIVKSFVELMEGTITVESKVGIGSTFTVILPLEIVSAPASHLQENQEIRLDGISILMAEDNGINAEIAMLLLERKGAKVVHVLDGQAAVEAFRDSPEGTYDIILMDIQMPKMNGLEATKEIRKLDREDAKIIPILSMTANAFYEQKEEMLQAGMNDFLYKPIEMDVVCQCIRRWVGEE